MSKTADSIIIGCWVVFLLYWLISAQTVKAIAEKQSGWSALRHRLPVGLGWWLLAFHGFPPPLNHHWTTRTDLTQIIGAAICVAGLLVTIWARKTLAGNWSSDVTFKHDHELVQSGPYRFARHPIYTGLLCMCLGSALNTGRGHAWLGLAVVFVGFWIKLRQEEKLMLQHFPADYPAYCREVKALVPFVF